jgi:hypothetical protein
VEEEQVHRCLAETSFHIMIDFDLFQSTMSLFSILIGTSSSSISILIRSLKRCNEKGISHGGREKLDPNE